MKAFHEVRSYDSDFMVWHSAYTNISFLAHWHKEVELIYIRSGSAKISITDHIFTAYEGDLVYCDSGNIHYSDSFEMDNCIDFILFDSNMISSRYKSSDFAHPLITKKMLEQNRLLVPLHRLIHTISTELSAKESYYQDIVKAALREFWYLLMRKIPHTGSETQGQNKRMNMLDDFQLLLSYLDEYYADNITLDFAAEKMHFSGSHFSKVFKKMTGINYVTYLNMVRIEHAATALKNSRDKITDIALSCGFNNIRTFNRVFKEITGYTPSDYSKLADSCSYDLTYYKRKSMEQKFVENDSLTLVTNSKKLT